LLESAGKVCAEYQDAILRNLPYKRIQADEIWSFVLGKDKEHHSRGARLPAVSGWQGFLGEGAAERRSRRGEGAEATPFFFPFI
jgi:hypothetical protein